MGASHEYRGFSLASLSRRGSPDASTAGGTAEGSGMRRRFVLQQVLCPAAPCTCSRKRSDATTVTHKRGLMCYAVALNEQTYYAVNRAEPSPRRASQQVAGPIQQKGTGSEKSTPLSATAMEAPSPGAVRPPDASTPSGKG